MKGHDMTHPIPATAFAIALSLGLAACQNDAEEIADDGVVEALPEELNAEAVPVEAAGKEAGAAEAPQSSATPSEKTNSSAMESGSNDDAGARLPDAKRSKLIKADPN